MSAFNRWRWLAFAGVVLLIAWATGSSGKQLPSLSRPTPQQSPSALDALKGTLPLPEIPQAPSVTPVAPNQPPVVPPTGVNPPVTPTAPPLPAKSTPVAPLLFTPPAGVPVSQIPAVVTPSALEITEPVATVHRFTGKYLGDDGRQAILYVETGDGKAEVQSRPLAPTIPDADANTPNDVKRLAVTAGKVTHRDGRAFVTTSRELLVIGTNCEIEWRFTLPGKPDNGETLLDVAGFHDGKVYLVGQCEVGQRAPSGRVFSLDAASGRMVSFSVLEEKPEPAARFHLDDAGNTLTVLGANNVRQFRPGTGALLKKGGSQFPNKHMTVVNDGIITSTSNGIGWAGSNGYDGLLPGELTAPVAAGVREYGSDRLYLPLRTVHDGALSLTSFNPPIRQKGWQLPVKQPITAAPVVRDQSVYFVAGNVLYRVNAATGAICWKHTLALNPGESLTELAFVGDELRGSGPGVFVRVTERPSPPAPTPIPGAVPVPPVPVP